MGKSVWTMRARGVALGGALGLIVLAAFMPSGARAQDDDDKNSIWNLDKRLLDGVMRGLGLRSGNESDIEYRERSPLVVPPNRNLPPPEAANTARSAAWPADPDVKRRQDAAAKRKSPDRLGYDPDREGRNLSPSELNPAGANSRRTGTPPNPRDGNTGDDGRSVRPSELGYFGGIFNSFGGQKEEFGTFSREPSRGSLTAPPAGYQTPSREQPYGISPKAVRPTVTPLDPAVGSP